MGLLNVRHLVWPTPAVFFLGGGGAPSAMVGRSGKGAGLVSSALLCVLSQVSVLFPILSFCS